MDVHRISGTDYERPVRGARAIVMQSAGKPGGRKSRMAFLEYPRSSDVIERHFGSGGS